MARTHRKDQPKPLLRLRPDFVMSLDNTVQQATLLVQAVEMVLSKNVIDNKGVAEILRERSDALRDALFKEPE